MDLQSSKEELQKIVEKVSAGVVQVVVYDKSGGEAARGSGFVIDRDGRVLTNAVILRDAYSAEVISESGYYDTVIVLKIDEDMDLALIKVNTHDEQSLELDAESQLEQEQRVIAIGRAGVSEKTLSEGIISSKRITEGGLEIIQILTTKPLLPLSPAKDGPLFNLAGKVIGITSTSLSAVQSQKSLPWVSDDHIMYAVSIHSIKDLLSKPDKIQHLHRSRSKVWLEWFKKKLESYLIAGYLLLHDTGSQKIIAFIVLIAIVISFIHWLVKWIYGKMKRI
jgi:S1-C subfamily serine protease